MRPFYLKADIEGRNTELAGGPRRNDGEMSVEILQKNCGESDLAFKIESRQVNNELVTTVFDHSGNKVAEYRTQQ